jgi:predicted nucleic acid-binding protein
MSTRPCPWGSQGDRRLGSCLGPGGCLSPRFAGILRFKLDENLPRRAAGLLLEAGHDVSTVADEGLVGHPDGAVAEAAAEDERTLVTMDKDFGDLRSFRPAPIPESS